MSLFVAFEGLDGAGLSTQAKLLSEFFKKQKFNNLITKEPTNGFIGGIIRAVLKKELKLNPTSLQLLFAADRSYHIETSIKPFLKKGKIVICDRYKYSSYAFGKADELDLNWLKSINQDFLTPDIIFFIDVPPQECIKRIKDSREELELFEKEEKLKKVRENFLTLVKETPNFHRIDGTQTIKEVHEAVVEFIRRYLKENKKNLQKFL